ncbi:MAG: hypothetical protein ACRBK7_26385 [Acidimicrobiales bacterium]
MTDTEALSSAGMPSIDPEEIEGMAGELLDALFETMPALASNSTSALSETWLSGRIAFLGGPPAEATIVANAEIGARLAVGYQLVDEGAAELEDAVDAFSEFINVMGGSLKAAFDEQTALGIPVVQVVDRQFGETEDFVVIHHPVGQLSISIVTG